MTTKEELEQQLAAIEAMIAKLESQTNLSDDDSVLLVQLNFQKKNVEAGLSLLK